MTGPLRDGMATHELAGFAACYGCGETYWEPQSATDVCWVCLSTDWVVLPTESAAIELELKAKREFVHRHLAKLEAAGWPDEPCVCVVAS